MTQMTHDRMMFELSNLYNMAQFAIQATLAIEKTAHAMPSTLPMDLYDRFAHATLHIDTTLDLLCRMCETVHAASVQIQRMVEGGVAEIGDSYHFLHAHLKSFPEQARQYAEEFGI